VRRARRIAAWTALAALGALAGAAILFGPGLLRAADVGAGYAAKVVCSCALVGGRPLGECRADLPAEFERVETELLDGGAGARARVLFGLVERRALHHPGAGCALQ
jgi:hypothetical protein